jgi:hypothetical protein
MKITSYAAHRRVTLIHTMKTLIFTLARFGCVMCLVIVTYHYNMWGRIWKSTLQTIISYSEQDLDKCLLNFRNVHIVIDLCGIN